MALPKMTVNVNNIQGLSDRPNTADGLTASQLKEKFDKAGQDIKNYLNDTLLPACEKELKNFIDIDDARLSDSRKCNNEFDNPKTARENLKIKIVTSNNEMTDTEAIYLKYIP